jgi:hypothetical protein
LVNSTNGCTAYLKTTGIPSTADNLDRRIGDQCDFHLRIVRHEPEGDFRNIEDRLPLSRFGDAQDVLTGGDDLSGFRVDRSDDTVDVGIKLGIAGAHPTLRRSPALAVGDVLPSAWPCACLPGSSCSL